jgi:hypothetical protein
MKFSQRQGIKPSNKPLQLDFIDKDLLNGLWNIFKLCILDTLKNETNYQKFAFSLWHNFFKLPVDRIPYTKYDTFDSIREWFFSAKWFEIYDFIEFCLNHVSSLPHYGIRTDEIEVNFNVVLEREFSAFRFIQGKISPITNEEEIGEINTALTSTKSFTALSGCNIHLHSALTKLSDRKNPDYRNSIKESISAIESLAKVISNHAKDSLSASLDRIKGKIKIHPALEKGFKQIYGYTSDDDGIRHALTEESTCDFEDAKFMLISCSAFINYLIVKTEKAGLKI